MNTSCSQQLHDVNGRCEMDGQTDYTITIFDSSHNGTSTIRQWKRHNWAECSTQIIHPAQPMVNAWQKLVITNLVLCAWEWMNELSQSQILKAISLWTGSLTVFITLQPINAFLSHVPTRPACLNALWPLHFTVLTISSGQDKSPRCSFCNTLNCTFLSSVLCVNNFLRICFQNTCTYIIVLNYSSTKP